MHRPRIGKPIAFRLALILALNVAATTPSHAQAPQKFQLQIPAQSLAASLDALAIQTGARLLYSPDAVQGRHAPALAGSLNLEMALTRLLQGTGLTWSSNNGSIAIRPRPGQDVSAPTDVPVQLQEITVTATRTERRVDQVPANVSIISSQDISQRNLNSVQDFLRTVESVEAGQSFSVAQSSSIDIRGVGGSYSAPTSKVLLDGMSTDTIVSQVQGNGGLNFLSPWDVEQVEVVRGPASALYGPEVIGGVVNLIPKRWSGDTGAEVHASYGSRNTSRVGVAVGSAGEIGDFRISTYNAGSDGFITQRQPDTPGGMISVDRAPRDWKDQKASFTGTLRPSDQQEITTSYQDFATHSFTQGGHPNQYLNLDGRTWSIGYRQEFGEAGVIRAVYRETHLEQHFGFDNEYVWGSPGDLGLAAKGGKSSDSSEFNLQADWNLSASNTLIAGYGRNSGEYKLHSMFGNNIYRNKSTVDGIYLQDEARFGRWSLLAGGRQDSIRMYGDTESGVSTNPSSSVNIFNPRLGAQYQWSDVTTLYGAAGTAYVPATNAARFIDGDIPNANLKPEKSTSYEFGLRTHQAFGDIKLALFHTNYRDKINRVEVAPGVGQNQNIDRVEVLGLELGWKARIREVWHPFFNYSYTDSTIKADATNPQNVGNRMPQTSVHKLNLGLLYVPGGNWSASLTGTLRSSQYVQQWYCPSDNTNTYECRLGGYATADAKLTRAIRPFGDKEQWNVWVAVNNLGDKHYRQYYPFEYSDGRIWSVGIDGKF